MDLNAKHAERNTKQLLCCVMKNWEKMLAAATAKKESNWKANLIKSNLGMSISDNAKE